MAQRWTLEGPVWRHLELEMESESLPRGSPHRYGRHRLDPHIYMLRSTLDVPVAPARAPEMSHRGFSVERQKEGSKRVSDDPEMTPKMAPEMDPNLLTILQKGSLEQPWRPQAPPKTL